MPAAAFRYCGRFLVRKKISLSCLLVAILLLLSSGTRGEPVPGHYNSRQFAAVGYFATINSFSIYEDLSDPEISLKISRTWEEIKEILERVELKISVSIPESDIYRYNQLKYGESVEVSEETVLLIELAREMSLKTEGYYDPTVFPLVDLWGFSPRFTHNREQVMPYDREYSLGALPPPDPRYIETFKKLVGMDGIIVEGGKPSGYQLRKMTPPVEVDGIIYQGQIDLGGIAKGYVTDLVSVLMEERGFEFGYFSSGTSSIKLMKSASFSAKQSGDSRFYLEIRKPRESAYQSDAYANIAVENQALSSSGDYDNNYLIDGDIYSHLINPFTGYPVNLPSGGVQQGISTVTLLSGSAAEDDAYTTALCLMGPEKALDFFNSHLRERDIAMVFFRQDKNIYEVVTNISSERLTIHDPHYHLASEVLSDGTIRYLGTFFD